MSPRYAPDGSDFGPDNPKPSWWIEPFTSESERGNLKGLVHGAHSRRIIEPIAAEYRAAALATFPLLADPSYLPAVNSWSNTEAALERIEDWVAEHGPLDDEGRPRGAIDALARLKSLAIKERDALGLTPRSRASIGAQLAAIRRASLYEPQGSRDVNRP